MEDLSKYFVKADLIPAIVIDDSNEDVLMMAYMNEESLKLTLDTGYTWFYSRSRNELWNKGATSGHTQKIVSIYGDCDDDTLLIRVRQNGPACHTGKKSCFFNKIKEFEKNNKKENDMINENGISAMYEVIKQRYADPQDGSYTCYLFDCGVDKILKKCAEENGEMIIAAKNNNPDELANEVCDLLFHMMVLLVERGVPLDSVMGILEERSKKIGNLKEMKDVDKLT